jgi:membrane-bound lytic murein transglycosylase B
MQITSKALGLILGVLLVPAGSWAQDRPTARPGQTDVVSRAAPVFSLRPAPRMMTPVVQTANRPARFENWIDGFRRRALSQGISAATFDRAFAQVDYMPDVIRRDRNQAEFSKQLWEYLDTAVSEARVRNGKSAFDAQRSTLRQIEARFGVEAEVVTAIWGLESAYGGYRGNTPLVSSLATLAYDGRRGKFFEAQLIAALKILQAGDVTPQKMTGSWAGAMGHTQFMPTSYLDYAVDFTGDGKRDIWSDNPTDALASTAAYLKHFGWTKGQPWGVEVRLPQGFDYGQTGEKIKKSPNVWANQGVRDINGRVVPNHGRASILVPAGSRGAAFMIFDNFHVIERYNTADAYVIAVGHLSDRIVGGPAIQASWPRGDRGLSFSEKKEMQRLLGNRGFSVGKIDGIIGPNTIQAVRQYQSSVGLEPDGYASLEILKKLR